MYNVMVVEDQAMPRQLFEAFISMSDKYRLVHSLKMPIWQTYTVISRR